MQELEIDLLTIVTSILSFVPVFISQISTRSGCCESCVIFTNLVPRSVRRWKQIPSAEVPVWMIRFSSKIVTRAQFSFRNAWFGQHSIGAGSFGGATRLDGSKLRQSPLGKHGGDKQVSCKVGTQTSCKSHPLDIFERMQFFKPHQTFEHFGLPLAHIHELQIVSSLSDAWFSVV